MTDTLCTLKISICCYVVEYMGLSRSDEIFSLRSLTAGFSFENSLSTLLSKESLVDCLFDFCSVRIKKRPQI